jgi:hypothetical protein
MKYPKPTLQAPGHDFRGRRHHETCGSPRDPVASGALRLGSYSRLQTWCLPRPLTWKRKEPNTTLRGEASAAEILGGQENESHPKCEVTRPIASAAACLKQYTTVRRSATGYPRTVFPQLAAVGAALRNHFVPLLGGGLSPWDEGLGDTNSLAVPARLAPGLGGPSVRLPSGTCSVPAVIVLRHDIFLRSSLDLHPTLTWENM